jgi:hypothetical protein
MLELPVLSVVWGIIVALAPPQALPGVKAYRLARWRCGGGTRSCY